MLRHFFILTFRNWKRESKITLINLFGLSLGIASAILLYIFIMHEHSFEEMHVERDNIHRLYITVDGQDGGQGLFLSPYLGPALKEEMPEVSSFVRIVQHATSVIHKDKHFQNEAMLMVDSTFFDLFNFEILEGNPIIALKEPSSIILTKTLADKLFPDQDALNQGVDISLSKVNLSTGQMNHVITRFHVGAVIKDPPTNTHLQFSLLSPIYAADSVYFSMGSHVFATYLLFDRFVTTDIYDKITQRSGEILSDAMSQNFLLQNKTSIEMQNLNDIRFGVPMYADISPQGNKQTIWVFIILAFFILIIAIANFINLSTARSEKRLVEAGIKKVLGSNRFNLICHYIAESVLLTFLGLLIALFAIEIALPAFSGLMGQKLILASLFSTKFVLFLLLFAVSVGLAAGFYPAYHFSRYAPIAVLKGKFSGGTKPWLRIILVIFQFAISVFLIVAVWIVNDQIRYMHKEDNGFDSDKILVFRNVTPKLKNSFASVKEELLTLPQVSNVVTNNGMPGHISFGLALRSKEQSDEANMATICFESHGDYLDLFQIKLLQGDWLDDRIQTSDFEFVINETAAKRLELDNPIGQEVILQTFPGKIIGVVQDFHFESKHSPIRPLVFTRFMSDFQRIAIKVEGDNIIEAQNSIFSVLKKADDTFIDEGIWLDQLLKEFYASEDRTFKIIRWASLIAIIIGLIGLIGLTNYMMLARKQEICIRKVLGASYSQITGVLLSSMLKWVLLANLIAWPLAWYAADIWLNNFAYRIKVSPHYFLVAGLASLIITTIVIVSQSYREILRNPVDGLKAE